MSRRALMGLAMGLAVAAAACKATPPQERGPAARSPALRARVVELLAEPQLARAVQSLRLDEDGFARLVVPSYRGLYPAYARAFAAAAPALVAELQAAREAAGGAPEVRERRHYSGDATLSAAQARTRWAQPVQSESWLVELDGKLVDTVWVRDGAQWRSLLGTDRAALDVLAAAAPTCAAAAERAGAPGPCSDAVWAALDGALRGKPEVVARSCERAQALCMP